MVLAWSLSESIGGGPAECAAARSGNRPSQAGNGLPSVSARRLRLGFASEDCVVRRAVDLQVGLGQGEALGERQPFVLPRFRPSRFCSESKGDARAEHDRHDDRTECERPPVRRSLVDYRCPLVHFKSLFSWDSADKHENCGDRFRKRRARRRARSNRRRTGSRRLPRRRGSTRPST